MKRPISATLALCLVLILTIWSAIKVWTFISWSPVLSEFSSRMPSIIGIVSGTFWFIIGLILAASIILAKPWSAKVLPAAAIGHIAWYWIERLAWQAPRLNAPFVIAADIACLVFIYFASKSLSREAYERDTEPKKVE
jgi:hypothetical protein